VSESDAQPPAAPDSAAKAQRRARLGFAADVVLLGVCGYVLASDAGAALSGEVDMDARMGAFLLNLTAAFVLLRRLLIAVQALLPGPGVWRMAALGRWVLLITVPLIVAGYLEKLNYRAHRLHVDALAADVAARIARANTTQRRLTPADLNDLAGPYLRTLRVRTDTGAFLLEVALPGLDVDGYTGRYASTEGRWLVQHNDEETVPAPDFTRSGPLLVCRRADSMTRCEAS